MPNDAELARTGLSFDNAFCNTAMCSPSRATLFTGRYPAEHGVGLTLTAGRPAARPRNRPAVTSAMAGILRHGGRPARRVLRQLRARALRLGPKSGGEPVLPPEMPNMATLLRAARLRGRLQGQVAPDPPVAAASDLLGGWTAPTPERLERDYGFADWEAPDAGENAKASQLRRRQRRRGGGLGRGLHPPGREWLGRVDLPEPFCLVVSLVNPHDVLGYPASYVRGGYSRDEFRELGVDLPPTVEEDLSTKPAVHSLMRMGMAAYLGPLRDREAQLDYVNFYAHLHRVVDEKIGRLVAALGVPGTRSRCAPARGRALRRPRRDGPSPRRPAAEDVQRLRGDDQRPAGGLEPGAVRQPAETEALASLVDVLPTVLTLAGRCAPAGCAAAT